MTFFLPLGLEDAKVDRVPWVSITLAALCIFAFIPTWVLPAAPMGESDAELQDVLEFYQNHPALALDARFQQKYLGPRGRAAIEELHRKVLEQPPPGGQDTLAEEQGELDARVAKIEQEVEHSPLRRFALVPARGLFQRGWLTHMFLHFGWLHLLGNLFFFYLVGPVLEDVWGRPLFAALYLVGGLVGGLAHYLLAPGSVVPMAGASGAIATCIGAFTFRYAASRMRVAYLLIWFRIYRGIRSVPAWLWGGLWFAHELFTLLTHETSGVAVMAHVGGFGFGFAVAATLGMSGLEKKVLAPALERKTTAWVRNPLLDEAQAALDRGALASAKAAYGRVLVEDPSNVDAQLALAKLALSAKEPSGMGRAERLFQQLLSAGSDEALWNAVVELTPVLDLAMLRPALANRIALSLERAPEGLHPLMEGYLEAAGRGGGLLGAKALLRAAELCIGRPERAAAGASYVARVEATPGLPPELGEKVRALKAQLPAAPAPQSTRLQGGVAVPPMRIVPCRAVSLDQGKLTVESLEHKNVLTLDWRQVLQVGVGALPSGEVLTDLLVRRATNEKPAMALRIARDHWGLAERYPGSPIPEAHLALVRQLLRVSGAAAVPDAGSLQAGQLPRFATEAALSEAFYAPASAPLL